MLRLLAAAAFVASVSVSCSEISFIEINPPADLQEKIDAIQAEKDAANAALGDRTPIEITSAVVGLEDCTTPWWAHFSDYFAVPTNKRLVVKFTNHGSLNEIYHNWILVVTNPNERATTNYAEYFALRADAHAWAGAGIANLESTFDIAMLKHNYADVYSTWDPANADCKAAFLADMNGAEVVLEIDHAKAGVVFVTATATSADGSTVLVETYEQKVSATEDIWAFVLFEGAYGELHEAYLEPSKIEEIPDEVASAITVTGTPSAIEVGSDDFWGKGVATVTYADGSSTPVDTADVNFVVPDLSTAGTKTILYSYSKTKQGNYGPSVAGYYTLQVVNPVVKLEVTKAPSYAKYYVYDAPVAFNPAGIEVTATYADGSSSVIDNAMLTFGTVPADGTQKVVVSYVGNTSTVTVDCPVEVIKGTGAVGVSDCSGGFWGAHTSDHVIAAGESYTFKFFQYSTGEDVWNGACTILRNIDWATNNVEYVVTRPDNYGWGTGWEGTVGTPGWPSIEALQAALNMAMIEVTVTNNGDDTASIKYTFNCANGETYTQEYSNIAVVSSDLSAALTIDECYLVFID